MDNRSSDRSGERRGRSSQSRNRSGARSGGRGGSRDGDRSRDGRGGDSANRGARNRERKPAPKPTGWQKFVKAITFGLVDPFQAEQDRKRAARKKNREKPISVEPTGPRLYVGNLSYDVTEAELQAEFGKIGTVVEALVVTQGRTGRSKGFGFVEMGSLEEAKEAVRRLNDAELMGRAMLVTGAKTDKPEKKREDDWAPSGRERSERSSEERPRRTRERRESGGRGERGGRSSRGSDSSERESRTVSPRKVETVSSAFVVVGKLNEEATEEDFHDLFDGIGVIQRRSDGGAGSDGIIVELASVEGAQKAVELLHGKSFMGRQLTVKEAPEDARDGLREPLPFEAAHSAPTAKETDVTPEADVAAESESEAYAEQEQEQEPVTETETEKPSEG